MFPANGGILSIPKMSDKYNTQVEASIKAKGQLYCYLSFTQLLAKVVGPAVVKRVLGSKRPCFRDYSINIVCNSTGVSLITA